MKQLTFLTLATLVLAYGTPTHAQNSNDHAKHAAVSDKATTSSAAMADGEVRKIDKDTGKITLKHGVIKNLDMPAMTMVFTVKEKSLLDKVQAGDKVKFAAISEDGKYVVVDIAPVK